jgi:hypothetical protein
LPPLSITTEPDDDEVLALLRAVSAGSLDAGTVRSVEKHGVDAAARDYLADMDALPGGWGPWATRIVLQRP